MTIDLRGFQKWMMTITEFTRNTIISTLLVGAVIICLAIGNINSIATYSKMVASIVNDTNDHTDDVLLRYVRDDVLRLYCKPIRGRKYIEICPRHIKSLSGGVVTLTVSGNYKCYLRMTVK